MILRPTVALLLLGMPIASSTAAESFPLRPIRIVVNTAPGGLNDVMTRFVAERMTERVAQQVVVENRAGGDGLVGIRAVKAATPDGYTLLSSAGTIAIQPAVKIDPGYDLARDFIGIGQIVRSPVLMVVGAKQPDRALADFVARAKANPGKLSYGSAGVGTTTHVGAALYLQAAGLDLLHVPYKGNGAAMPDILSGRVDMIFEAFGSGAAKVKEGQLRALGVTAAKRLPGLPNVPTLAEQGVPGFNYYLYIALFAPAGTPKDVVQRLHESLRAATASPQMRERYREDGSEPLDATVEEFNEFLKRDVAAMAKLVSDIGLPKQ